ncbi:MAG: stage V sporulation protein AD [Clostridia bacterium]|nr:stage V sporulation protein AD [Clostridia bacterium]
MSKRLGKQTVYLQNPPTILATSTTVGQKEGSGPLAQSFDTVLEDDYYGEKTWEKAESKLQKETARAALEKASLSPSQINYILAGDLLNQCVGTHYGLRDLEIPFLGLYGACSTMVESMSIGAMLLDGDYADYVMSVTSSHFCSAERQFRVPLEYGGQRPPSAQWTVTGAGCAVLAKQGNGPFITHITTGKIVDMGITDTNNMGAAMAPAAFETITTHFEDTGLSPSFYDLILTGDLGVIGSKILLESMAKTQFDIASKHNDCGKMIFDIEKQDVHSGGSGCGCCGAVLCGPIFEKLQSGELNKILVVATGALMNTTIIQQGESIPSIAHAITIQKTL